MDGPRVIRFIIEPGNMTLHFAILNDTVRNVVVKGSSSQKQKVAWETDHAYLLKASDINDNKLRELLSQRETMDSIKFKNELKVIGTKRDSMRKLMVKEALKYIKQNPHSYFSGYLLGHWKRLIPTDTLQTYFSNLDSKVINSDLGKNTLDELFKLTDDWVFRQKFTDSVTYKSLKKINTIYDVSLPDAEGTETSFSKFKGNVLLIDFWASWCKPCIKNAPYLKKLSASMKNKPFKVISVSIDSDKDTWQRAIKKYGFPGVHLYDDKGFLSTFYKVLWCLVTFS
jgi:thiol-disulfide isomerase/thioredoxin